MQYSFFCSCCDRAAPACMFLVNAKPLGFVAYFHICESLRCKYRSTTIPTFTYFYMPGLLALDHSLHGRRQSTRVNKADYSGCRRLSCAHATVLYFPSVPAPVMIARCATDFLLLFELLEYTDVDPQSRYMTCEPWL